MNISQKRRPLADASGFINAEESDIQAGDAEEELGSIVSDHDDPADGFPGSIEIPVKQDIVADKEQCTAAGDQDAIQGTGGQRA